MTRHANAKNYYRKNGLYYCKHCDIEGMELKLTIHMHLMKKHDKTKADIGQGRL